MNKQRRAEIDKLIGQLEELKDRVDGVASEERDYYDNMPENMQNGDKGQMASDAADALETVVSDIGTAIDGLQQALNG